MLGNNRPSKHWAMIGLCFPEGQKQYLLHDLFRVKQHAVLFMNSMLNKFPKRSDGHYLFVIINAHVS